MAETGIKDNLCSRCAPVFQNPFPGVVGDESSLLQVAIDVDGKDFEHSAVTKRCFICRRCWLHMGEEKPTLRENDVVWMLYRLDHRSSFGDPYKDCLDLQLMIDWHILSDPQREYGLSFVITALDELPSPRIPDVRRLPPATGSDQSLDTLKRWMQNCVSEHSQCDGGIHNQDFIPSRLLHFEDSGDTWRLHVKSEDGDPLDTRWIALSYRWGQSKHLTLTASTYNAFRDGMRISELPKTFREVIQVARMLGTNYVWIDAMCIQQDSAEDWKHESQQMHNVYGNSFCTVAASWAPDPTGGLFHERDAADIRCGIFETQWATEGRPSLANVRVFQRDAWNDQIHRSPLHSRGWALQERLLPSRFISFTEHQILWDCNNARKCEIFAQYPPREYSEPRGRSERVLNYLTAESWEEEKGHMSLALFESWRDVIVSYSMCKLTLPTDKLVAIGGIASLFKLWTQDSYFYGIWRSRIFDFLLWTVDDGKGKTKKSTACGAPSWSWASIEGSVHVQIIETLKDGAYTYPFSASVHWDETAEESPDSGEGKGFLLLHGYRPAPVLKTRLLGDPRRCNGIRANYEDGPLAIWVQLDAELGQLDTEASTECYLVLLRIAPDYDYSGLKGDLHTCSAGSGQGIIIQQAPEGPDDYYVRIGYFQSQHWEEEHLAHFGLHMDGEGKLVVIAEDRRSTFRII
ncbi:HET-domain-containing protein [Amniculicola lignicola CBS 123094]|uniref:HET-domain-containing protein n=1 Tax=Amniculicola lignicola CBS 123094 TaxID=1392246 RepID=A0A6A5W6H7_9PLEO|nr:HET-domain-containing protein [Amniculicola lignicola CBS 123094]